VIACAAAPFPGALRDLVSQPTVSLQPPIAKTPTRFVFLDRDGTLVRDGGYVHRLEDYALLPGVVPALRQLAAAGFTLAIVTNQSGIGRGLYDESAYRAFEAHLEADLARQRVAIAASFFCPHRPDEGCACRKPAPGLFLRARDVLGADLGASFAIGNELRDAEAAIAAGCCGAVLIGHELPPRLPARTRHAPDLAAAAALILEQA
jgi:D-glycero-D-manno-heptose 1,7-bisphosphate phosphatase